MKITEENKAKIAIAYELIKSVQKTNQLGINYHQLHVAKINLSNCTKGME